MNNWAVKLREDDVLPGLTRAEADQILTEIHSSGGTAELVDLLDTLRARFPVGSPIRLSSGVKGTIEPMSHGFLGNEDEPNAYWMDHVGVGFVCVQTAGRPPLWFSADYVTPEEAPVV